MQYSYSTQTVDTADSVQRLSSLRKQVMEELAAIDQALSGAENTLPTVRVEE